MNRCQLDPGATSNIRWVYPGTGFLFVFFESDRIFDDKTVFLRQLFVVVLGFTCSIFEDVIFFSQNTVQQGNFCDAFPSN